MDTTAIIEARDFIRRRLDAAGRAVPKVAVVLGSGLGGMAARAVDPLVIPVDEVPGFPRPTVAGHRGELLFSLFDDLPVVLQRGRSHSYEGHDLEKIVFPVRVMAALGVGTVILSNAVGGIRPSYEPGDIVLVTDHINMTGLSPLRGPNDETLGPRFLDMTAAYDPELWAVARDAARRAAVHLKEGVLWFSPGPQYETPAEIRAIGRLGADLVGMSTVPSVVAAHHAGLRVLVLSCVTNRAAGLPGALLDHEDVLAVGRRIEGAFCDLVEAILSDLAEQPALVRPRRVRPPA